MTWHQPSRILFARASSSSKPTTSSYNHSPIPSYQASSFLEHARGGREIPGPPPWGKQEAATTLNPSDAGTSSEDLHRGRKMGHLQRLERTAAESQVYREQTAHFAGLLERDGLILDSSRKKMEHPSGVHHLAKPVIDIRNRNSKASRLPLFCHKSVIREAKSVFQGNIRAHPVLVAATMHRLPSFGIPQVCFIGESNVGKSSLLNALVDGRELAKSSGKPGLTRHLFTFDVGDRISLVDLPGYGIARAPVEMKDAWRRLVQAYVEQQTDLRLVVCLVDATKGISSMDEEWWHMIPPDRRLLVLTKVDLLEPATLHTVVDGVLNRVKKGDWKIKPFIHCVSSRTQRDPEATHGISELRAHIAAVCDVVRMPKPISG